MFPKQPDYSSERQKMVEEQIIKRGITDAKLISFLLKVPRHKFVPEEYREHSYYDGPLPIGGGQTISQPYIVALMTELLDLNKNDKVLEIGTGCGYQTAILAEYGCDVYTIEIVKSLSINAQRLIERLGYVNIKFRVGDGYEGWQEYAPFDAIIVTASPHNLPQPLVDQLKEGGRMVIPIEEDHQDLCLITKEQGKMVQKKITPVQFVPMTGEAQKGLNS
jgi:protein-L-isoaspartate(D-aspartate) O-methyltransferase